MLLLLQLYRSQLLLIVAVLCVQQLLQCFGGRAILNLLKRFVQRLKRSAEAEIIAASANILIYQITAKKEETNKDGIKRGRKIAVAVKPVNREHCAKLHQLNG
ncbi:hypothetical protein D3C73_1494320 [compost metagenome]